MAFALLSRSSSKPQGSVKPATTRKSARAQHPADSRSGFAKPVFQPPTTALPTTPAIQAKLKIGEPNDRFKQKADRVAEQEGNGNSSVSPSAEAQSRSPVGNLQRLNGNQSALLIRPGFGSPLAPSGPLRSSQGGILQRKCACGGAAGTWGECEECSKQKRLGLQTKLKINEPGDIYEQEADRIADQVMATPAHHAVSGAPPRIQRSSGQSNGQADAAPASVDQALANPGRPLEPPLRQDMEQRFGHDFSRVRVHSGADDEQSARELNANAYTVGHDIVFGAGRFVPGTQAGRRLIAHELTHVVQQDASHRHNEIQRKAAASTFAHCADTGITNADLKVENGRQMAICYLQVTIRDLKGAPTASTASKTYKNALKVHFINPDEHERATIRENYQRILGVLKDTKNIVCASSKDDLEECQKQSQPVGFVRPGEGTVILCPIFHEDSITCRAILLIHEASHTIGIGAKSPHPPYRGTAEYPGPAAATPGTQTTAMRMDNPDAYAYFAANIWRETDTHCLPAFQFNQTIEVVDTASKTESK
jgi:Domain of unknown function (DUF4157)/Lysine-specific metallo-endopeptidase